MKASVNMSTRLITLWFRKVQEELDSSSDSVSNTIIVFSAQIGAVLVVSNVRYLMSPTSVHMSSLLEGPYNHFQ